MFSKVALIVAAFAAVAIATPLPGGTDQCNTGSIHCCESTYESSSPLASLVSSLIGLDLSGVTGLIGTQCSSLSVVGGGTQCTQQPVCCSNNASGLVVVNCSPISL